MIIWGGVVEEFKMITRKSFIMIIWGGDGGGHNSFFRMITWAAYCDLQNKWGFSTVFND
jgi:hypothetical protein